MSARTQSDRNLAVRKTRFWQSAAIARPFALGRRLKIETLESRHLLASLSVLETDAPDAPAAANAPGDLDANDGAHEIAGTVWNDTNGNQLRDGGEVALVGRTVYLDTNRNGRLDLGEISTQTVADDPATADVDEAGTYRFEGLAAGVYPIREAVPFGWETTTPTEGRVVALGGTGLQALRDSLSTGQAHITSLIPGRYDFLEGTTGTAIVDGGRDMYDVGNILNTNRQAAIPYTAGQIVSSDASFGPSSSYFTAKYPGLFVLAANNVSISHFEVSGATGANGEGSIGANNFVIEAHGKYYIAFLKNVYDAGDPSINHLVIVPYTGSQWHSHASSSASDQHRVSGLENTDEIYYLLTSRQGGTPIAYETAWAMASAFLARLPLQGTVVENVAFGSRPQGKLNGFVWHDRNEDGIRDEAEPGLAGFTVYIDANGNGVRDTAEMSAISAVDDPQTTANETGFFVFTRLPPVDTNIRIVPREGWTATGSGELRQVRIGTVDLATMMGNLDFVQAQITTAVPQRNDFQEGASGNAIVNGGQNMYDVGNRLSTDRATDIAYTNHAVAAGDAAFGPGSHYFTAKYSGLFVAAVAGMAVDRFTIAGRTGTGGAGRVVTTRLPFRYAEQDYTVFVKQIIEAATPSIVHAIVVPGDGMQIEHQFATDTGDDFHALIGLNGIDRLYYLLTSQQGGALLSEEHVREMVDAFLSSVTLGSLEVVGANLGQTGNYQISGAQFHDANNNATHDAGEPGLPGWTIYIDENDNGYWDSGEPHTVTAQDDPATPGFDEAGHYLLERVPPGSHHVRTVRQPGWRDTSAEDGTIVNLGERDLTTVLASLNAGSAAVANRVPNRFNFTEGDTGNYIFDGGSNMYEGGNYLATNLNSAIPYSDRTLADGSGSFGGVSQYFTAKYPGLFVLATSKMQIDSFQIWGYLGASGSGRADVTRFSTVIDERRYTVFVKRVYGANVPSVNHLFILPGDAPNVVHNIEYYTYYDYDYLYGLTGERELYYLLVSRQAGGYLQNADAKNIADEFLELLPPPTASATNVNFFSSRTTEINGMIWRDRDGDGLREPGEPGLAGWTVYLDSDNDGQFDAGEPSTVSAADNPQTFAVDEAGRYSFAAIPEGTHVVRRVVPIGWATVSPTDSAIATLTLNPDTTNGNVAGNIDFGHTPIGRVEGFNWHDLDADGIRDPNEPGLAGWTIYVDENNDGQFQPHEPHAVTRDDDPATTTVIESGLYAIEGVSPENPLIRAAGQPGWRQRYPQAAHSAAIGVPDLRGLLANLDANHASITNQVSSRYDFLEGESGINIADGGGDMYEVGNYISTSRGGYLPYSNRQVAASDAIFGVGSRYFTAKYPGLFALAVDGMSIDRFTISGALGAWGAGAVDGAVRSLTVGGQQYTMFIKRVFDAGDPSVNHLIIVPGDESNLSHEFSTYTADDYHSISGLQGRSKLYYLLVSRQNGGRLGDAAAVFVARQFLMQIPPPEVTASNLDFGIQQIPSGGEIRGVAWDDIDRDGLRDAGEPLQSGWTVYLDTNNNGQLDPSERRVETAVDDPLTLDINESGVFAFTNLSGGIYRVAQVNRSGWLPSAPAESIAGRRVHLVTLSVGHTAGNLDFGNHVPGADVDLRGNGQSIPINDATPSASDGTDLGVVEIGGDRAEQTFTIVNTGELPLALQGDFPITIVGANASDFAVVVPPNKSILAASESVSFTVRFIPNAAGARHARIEVATSDPDEASYAFSILGTGYQPNIRAIDDEFSGAEEATFVTAAAAGEVVIPFRAGGWAINDELSRTVGEYPFDELGRTFMDRNFDTTTSRTSAGPSLWDQPLTAPFDCTPPNCNGQVDALATPKTNVHVPAASETTFLARRLFTLTAAQANAIDGTITYTCDSGCIFYINGVYAGASPNMQNYGYLPGPNAFAFDSGDESLPHATISGNLAAFGIPLFEGDNMFAVEIHNDDTTSSDIGFDASLSLTYDYSGLLANDDLDNAVRPLSITLHSSPVDAVTGANAGTVELIDQSGNFRFTPRRDFHGRARFEYRIENAGGYSIGDAVVVVAPQNDAPVALADSYAGDATEPLVIGVVGHPLIEANDGDWYYIDDGQDQDALNPDWRASPDAGFDPAAAGWRGPHPAQLGFGEGDEHTPINNSGYYGGLTYYFFTTFDLIGTPQKLILDLKQDDGAAVYINGAEVITANLPNPHPYYVGALETLDDDGQSFVRYELDPATLNLLPTGNTLAVEVHQFDWASSDVTFDLRLFDPGLGLLANDEDVDDPASGLIVTNVISSLDPATVGTVAVQPDGTFTFTPANTHLTGVFTFTYQTRDSAGNLSAPTPVTLTITTRDKSPFMTHDDYGLTQFVTLEDTPLVIDLSTGPSGPLGIGLLANDSHPGDESAPVTFILDRAPDSGGTVVFDAANDGGFTYTPGANFDGIDTFAYRVHDGYTLSNAATVSIVVNSVDDPPIAQDDSYSVNVDAVLNVDRAEESLLANDVDVDGDALEGVALIPNTGPHHGILSLEVDGRFSYTPAAGFVGTDSFQYSVEAGGVRSAPALVTIEVLSVCAHHPDVSGNGTVGLEDLALVVDQFGRQVEIGSATALSTSDLNCDGSIGLRDAIQLRQLLASSSPTLAHAPAVLVAGVPNGAGIVQNRNVDEALAGLNRDVAIGAVRRGLARERPVTSAFTPHTTASTLLGSRTERDRHADSPRATLRAARNPFHPTNHDRVLTDWRRDEL